MHVTYTKFNPDGTPIRARARFDLEDLRIRYGQPPSTSGGGGGIRIENADATLNNTACSARTVEDGGSPLGTDDSYYDIRAIERLLPEDVQWLDALKDQMYPTGAPF